MHYRSTFLVLLLALYCLWMFIPQPVSAQEATFTPEPLAGGILFPGNDATLSGEVEIRGTALSAWDLSFSYADEAAGNWFSLIQSTDPVSDGVFATWDTTAITDGFYVLRLRVSAADALQEFKANVRVRNYSPGETSTPTLTLTTVPDFTPTPNLAPEVIATETFTPVSSPTISPPLPPNPATLKPQEIVVVLGKAALGVALVFAFFGAILWFNRRLRG
jgi:hypothetical protein